MALRKVIADHAAELRTMHARIHRTFRLQPHGSEHRRACALFRSRYDSLAFPGGLAQSFKDLKQLKPQIIEIAIQFLEEDPYFHRSGYIKEEIVRRLKHAPLKPAQCHRLAAIVVRSATRGPKRLAREYARLAPIVHSPTVLRQLQSLAQSSDPEQVRRATHVLDLLQSDRPA